MVDSKKVLDAVEREAAAVAKSAWFNHPMPFWVVVVAFIVGALTRFV